MNLLELRQEAVKNSKAKECLAMNAIASRHKLESLKAPTQKHMWRKHNTTHSQCVCIQTV